MSGKNVLIVLSTAAVMCVGSALTASQLKVNFGGDPAEAKNAATADAGSAADIVKVKARGVGANKDEALKDAYRDAVERAIGLYVDAEQMVKNDEVVQDQVLTHSNAYITHYEEVDTKSLSGGLVQVKIVADVKKGQLTKKLEGVMPPQTVKVNGGILSDAYAQIVSKEKRAGDSAALLRAALKDCDPIKSLIVAGVRADSQKLLTGDQAKIDYKPLPADKVMLRYLFELKLDREKYFKEFVPHLKKTLEQISLTKPKEVRLSSVQQDESVANEGRKYLAGEYRYEGRYICYPKPQYPGHIESARCHCPQNGCLWPLHEYTWGAGGSICALPVTGYASLHTTEAECWRLVANVGGTECGKVSKFYAALVTQLNGAGSLGKMSLYELDVSLKPVVDRMVDTVVGTKDGSRTSIYNIVFADKDGNELIVEPWKVPAAVLLNMGCATGNSAGRVHTVNDADDISWFITPFVGCFGENYLEWKSFVLDRELLKKIDTIKIELAE